MRTKVNNAYSMNKLQKAIDENEVIEFTKGTYRITKTLVIPSNRILLMDGAVLRRYCSKPILMTEADKNTKGYNGAHDIKIVGGTIEGMNDCGYSASDMVLLFHSCNVSFIGVTFLDNTGSHAIDLGGCKDTHIIGCKFLGNKSVGRDFRETIQIDYAYQGGIPYYTEGSPCFDDTHCEGVNIIGCEFGASKSYKPQYVAIGTHAQTNSKSYHKDIVIKGNMANGNGVSSTGSYGFFARLVNMRNVEVSQNVVKNYGRFVFVDSTPNTTAEGKGCKDVLVINNTVLSSSDRFKASSVWVDGTENNRAYNVYVRNNVFDKANSTSYRYCSNYQENNNLVR